MSRLHGLAETANRIALEARSAGVLVRAGMFGLDSPQAMKAMGTAMRRYGPFGGAPAVAAVRHGPRSAIIDDFGETTFQQLEDDVNRLASVLRSQKINGRTTVGIMCRNGRSPLLASFALARLGARCVWLNTGFSERQAQEVCAREGIELVVCDEEYGPLFSGVDLPRGSITTACENPAGDELYAMLAAGDPAPVAGPDRPGKLILLTSGTTGLPKGAPRGEPKSMIVPGALIERFPLRAGEVTLSAPPLLHGTGLFFALLSLGLGCTTILHRRFDALEAVQDAERHGVSTMILVPAMLQRLINLDEEELRARDLSRLQRVLCGGSMLPGDLATRAMNVLGDVVYNLYGSTEAGMAAMATPADLREAPGTAGRPLLGSRIRILGPDRSDVARGDTGGIFIAMTGVPEFEGYTGGGGKEVVDGFVSSGDLGHVDEKGRLYVDGREDDMIVSGGENVFPRELEDLLVAHDAIAEAAVVGVKDADFGQRLAAFVVLAPGAALSEAEVKDHVKANLARYKVPRDVVFLEELPRNAMGKVLKRELPAPAKA